MRVETQQLKTFLLDSGLVSSEDIEIADEKAQKTKKELGEILVKDGKILEEDLHRLEAYILGIPYVDLDKEKIDPKVLGIIPEPVAYAHNVVAFRKIGSDLEVAMLDPSDLETIDFIKEKSDLRILPRLTNRLSMKSALRQYQKNLRAEFGELIQKEAGGIVFKPEGDKAETFMGDLRKSAEDLPIVRIVDALIRHAILQRASDIHIEPTEKEVLVRYRIGGVLRDAMVLPRQIAPVIIARVKILSNLLLDERRLPQDGRFKAETQEEKISFSVSIIPTYDGEKAVMRLLREGVKGFTLEGLGFHGNQLDQLHKAIHRPLGMIIAAGSAGCGKTTVLYTILDILNNPNVNISTIEDPIEYRMPRINQMQVRADIGFTFAVGLRALIRQDPDIIMVSEIRDNETASLAVNAALTGHLVLSALYASSAAETLSRLISMKIEPFLISSTVNVIIARRLARRLCENKIAYIPDQKQFEDLNQYIDLDRVLEILKKERVVDAKANWENIKFYKPQPSADAPDGYKDRIGIHEVMEITPTIKNLIAGGATSDDLEKQAKKEGMMTMLEDGILKAVQGLTTIEEVLRVTRE